MLNWPVRDADYCKVSVNSLWNLYRLFSFHPWSVPDNLSRGLIVWQARPSLSVWNNREFINSGSASLKERADIRGHRVKPGPHTETKHSKDSGTQAVKVIQIYICICKICTNLRPRGPPRAHRRDAANANLHALKCICRVWKQQNYSIFGPAKTARRDSVDLNNISHRDGISSLSPVKVCGRWDAFHNDFLLKSSFCFVFLFSLNGIDP